MFGRRKPPEASQNRSSATSAHLCQSSRIRDHRSGPPEASLACVSEVLRKTARSTRVKNDLAMMTKALASFSFLEVIDSIDFQVFVDGGAEGPTLLRDKMSSCKHMLNVSNPSMLVPRVGRQLRILIRALGTTDRKLQELTLHLWTCNISDNGLYSPLSAKNVRFAWSAFAGLEKFDLCLSGVRRTIVEDCRMRSEKLLLTAVLRAATELESLWLELPRNDTKPSPGEYWKNIIQI